MGTYYYIPDITKRHIFVQSTILRQKDVAERFGVATKTVQRVVRNVLTTGKVSRPPLVAGRTRELSWQDVNVRISNFTCGLLETDSVQYLILLARHTPDIYLSELRHRLEVERGVTVHESTIYRSLHRAGYSMKKLSISAIKQSEDDRCQYLLNVGRNLKAKQLVFVDESACNRITTRRRCGWAPVGNRAKRHDYFIRGKR